MTADIQALIERWPHLRDPFEFYEKWQHFHREAAAILMKKDSGPTPDNALAYPRRKVAPLFQIFVSTFALPAAELEPLRRSLENGTVDFLRLPLDEVPDLHVPYGKDELAAILFLLSRPYFLALRGSFPQDGQHWKGGRCPLCSARPALASIEEGPKRLLHCSWCGTVGPYRFTGCPDCGMEETSKLGTLAPEGEKGFRVATCDACRTYLKIVEGAVLDEMTTDLADLASLPLDIVAQDREYVRKAPNPIGLKKIE